MLGGSPMVTRPTGSSRLAPRSSRACAISCSTATLWSNSRLPASVSATPRPLRRNSCWCSSVSRLRTCRLSAGCAMSSTTAALLKLPSSATCTKYSSCLRFMDRPDQDEIAPKSTPAARTHRRYCFGIPAFSITLRHLSISDFSLADISSGVQALASMPSSSSRFFTSGSASISCKRLIERLDDLGRRAGRREQRIPGHDVVIRQRPLPARWEYPACFPSVPARMTPAPGFFLRRDCPSSTNSCRSSGRRCPAWSTPAVPAFPDRE